MSQPSMLPFIDLQAQRAQIGDRIEARLHDVLEHGRFILGPEVVELEAKLAEFGGAEHCLSCASGTDALALVLMVENIKPGDAVICPSFTFAATAEVVVWLGAVPVFADIDSATFNLTAESVEAAIARAKDEGLQPKGLIAVDLFGHPADYDRLEPVCAAHGLWLMDDAAQGFGGVYKGRKIGSIGHYTATSFFPAKPLGCYGDGGAVFLDDPEKLSILQSLRVHGQGEDKYDNVRIGMNGRMDTMQAAVLLEKLAIFPDEIERRDAVALRYNDLLADSVTVPTVADGCTSVWAQYTVRLPHGMERTAVQKELAEKGVPTAVYYPRPLHQQTAYRHFPVAGNGLPVSEAAAKDVLSLPMHPYLNIDDQDRVVDALRAAVAG